MLRLFTLLMLLIAPLAHAEMDQAELQKILTWRIEAIKHMGKNSLLLAAVQQKNAAPETAEQIQQIDQAWRAGNSPNRAQIENTKASKYIKHLINQMSDTYGEAFVTDAMGANVAMYPATSDYWQGDEDAFIKAWADGKGAVFIDSVSWDDSTQSNAVKISVPMLDGGKAIGVLVMGVKLSAIEAQKIRDLKRQSP